MTATRETHCNRTGTTGNGRPVLFLAFELGWSEWKLAFTIGPAQKPRLRTIVARDLAALAREIAAAKLRFGLPADARVISGYEAGRDAFWLDRYLRAHGIENIVVDSASIEVNRRGRRAKTDRLDATKLVLMLMRWFGGEPKLWSVVRVPSDADEDGRQLHREIEQLKDERTSHTNRIKGLLAGQVPTPYSSGGSEREQGISKAGNRRLRRMMVELAWCWLLDARRLRRND